MGNQASQIQQPSSTNQSKPASQNNLKKENITEAILVNDDDVFQEILQLGNGLLNDYRSRFLQEDFCEQLALVFQDKLSHINIQLLKSMNNKVNSNEHDENLMMVLQYLPKTDDTFQIDIFQEKLKDYFWKQNISYSKEKLETIQNIKIKGDIVKNASYVIDFKHVNKLLGEPKNNSNKVNVKEEIVNGMNTLVEQPIVQGGGGKKRKVKRVVFRIKKVSKSQKGGQNNSREINKTINELLMNNNNNNNNNANYSNNNNENNNNENEYQNESQNEMNRNMNRTNSVGNYQKNISEGRKKFLENNKNKNKNFSNANAVKLIQRDLQRQKFGKNNRNKNKVSNSSIARKVNENLMRRLGKNNVINNMSKNVLNKNQKQNNTILRNNSVPKNNIVNKNKNTLNKNKNLSNKNSTNKISSNRNSSNKISSNKISSNKNTSNKNTSNKNTSTKENIVFKVDKKLKYFVPRSYQEPSDFCKGEKVCKMTKKQICQSITENIIVRMNIVAAILTTIPYKNEKGEYEGGICYRKYLNLIDCKVCVPYNYEQLVRSDVYDMVNQIINHAEYLDKESCKASQGYFLELNNAQKEALISRRSTDDKMNPATKFNEFYIECMDKLKDKYFEILKALIVILKNLQENVIISNADLNLISTEVKRLIDDLYNSCHCYYVLAIIALIKSDIRVLEKEKFNYDALYDTVLHNKNIGVEVKA